METWSIAIGEDQNPNHNMTENQIKHRKARNNKTKYTMEPGIHYLLEADEDNTNTY